ncbi:hypothetical protein HN682_05570 [Candidatus Peregrinibacteria bacterium]|jgi:hypothetical protein|nr:hypothetical protein [Candidatus Peregrinibacteria bacterium]
MGYHGHRNLKKDFINNTEIESYNLAQSIKKMKTIASNINLRHIYSPDSREASMITSLIKIIKHIDTPTLISEEVED